ncbi:MAG: mannitol-1-phosphate 5-dehydrogenase, partial [Spirochaetales bacterium]|nr:mannitol-1-phosphate 5-dehydrogenase [Spirochaetales bacterium]MCF7938126.1 mannitol-1-phosphate 5-dehydrogenase [Spirochaetales bacterium]
NLMPVDNIRAYVDRKLFIHNMGHAASAYLGYLARPEATLLPDVLRSPGVLAEVRAAMNESADALAAEYPLALDREDLDEHIEDLIRRFQNHALGDTVYRVGRDLKRKLHKEDRLLGAVILAARHGLPRTAMETAFLSALEFRATDEEGRPFAGDEDFVENHLSKGLAGVLTDVCELDPREPVESTVYRELTERISGYR